MGKFAAGIGICLVVVAVLVLRPVPIVSEDKAIVETGIVANIFEAGVKDVVFMLEDIPRKFYINRGLEQGLNLEDLKNRLIGKEIILKYPKYWTPLDWNHRIKHVSKLEFNGEVLFNELKPSQG